MDATTALMMPTPPLRATKARVKCSKFLGDRHDSHCLFSPKRERALLPYSVSFALLCALQSLFKAVVFSELSLQFKAP